MLVWPRLIEAGLNCLVKPGRLVSTNKSAVAVPLLPRSEVRSPETLVCVPGELLVTSTVTLQLLLGESLAPLRLMVDPPSGASNNWLSPLQVVAAFAGVAIMTPDGRVSVKARSDAALLGSLLVISKVSVLMLPGPMVPGLKALLNVGTVAPSPKSMGALSINNTDTMKELTR